MFFEVHLFSILKISLKNTCQLTMGEGDEDEDPYLNHYILIS